MPELFAFTWDIATVALQFGANLIIISVGFFWAYLESVFQSNINVIVRYNHFYASMAENLITSIL